MFADLLLPVVPGLQLDQVFVNEHTIDLVVTTTQSSANCPVCAKPSTRVHSRYGRTVADLPWAGIPVRVSLQARRFFLRHRRLLSQNLHGTPHASHRCLCPAHQPPGPPTTRTSFCTGR
jgi:transposase